MAPEIVRFKDQHGKEGKMIPAPDGLVKLQYDNGAAVLVCTEKVEASKWH